MKQKIQKTSLEKRMGRLIIIIVATLTIPYFTNAPWTGFDYLFAGIVLLGCATLYVFLTRNMNNNLHRIIVALAVLFFILLIIAWAATGPSYESTQVIK